MLNPYAPQLGGHAPLEVIAATAGQLRALIDRMGKNGAAQAPAPGKWSAREIVCHLADCELVFAFRLRQTLAQDHHVVQPFDQEAWSKKYSLYTVEAALDTFSTLREWNLTLLRSAGAEELQRRVTHPERGEMTFQTIIETMGGHDRNHLKQIEDIAATLGESQRN